nr:hypothetical protein [Tanacetum cinerariifolium]
MSNSSRKWISPSGSSATFSIPGELTNDEIRNTKAYKEYYACATKEAAPKPKASARRKRSAKAKSPTDPSEVARTEAERLKIVLRRSRQELHISQLGGSSTDEGTGSKPWVPDVPSNDSEEEISWNSSDDEDVDAQDKDRNDDEGDKENESDDGKEDDDADKDGAERDDDDDDDDDEEEMAKIDEPEDTEGGGGDDEVTKSDGESEEEETREEEEESFDLIPRTPEDSEDDGNGKEDQGLRVSEGQRLIEEEKADELYRDVDLNQERGLQLSVDIEDSHVTLTPVNPDGQQESSSVSSQFMSSMLNPISDASMESIFATASSPMEPLQTSIPIMTPSTIATIITISHAPIPPTTIPSEVLQNLPTFDSVFHFEDGLESLEVNFLEFIQTNQFAVAVSNIPGIVHQYMNQQMTEAVQIQTDRLHDSYQRKNDEFLRTIDDNMKRIIKEQVKSQVKEQVSWILPRIKESVNAQLEPKVLTISSHSSRTSYAVAADLSEMGLKKILIEKMEGNKSIQRSDEQRNMYKALVDAYEADKTILDSYGEIAILKRRREDDDDQEGPSAGSDRGSTTESKSRQASASESAFAEEHMQTISQIEEPSHPMFETGANNQHIVQTSQHPECLTELEYHLEEVYKATTNQLDWVNPEGQ